MAFPRFDLIAEVIAALMWGPKSERDLNEITGYTAQPLNHLVRALEASGVVYRHSERPGTKGRPAQLFAMRPLPFHDPMKPPGKLHWQPSIHWIDVRCAKPHDRQDVLFYSSDLRNPTCMLLGRYIDGKFMCAGYEMVNVSHWAARPPAPGEEPTTACGDEA